MNNNRASWMLKLTISSALTLLLTACGGGSGGGGGAAAGGGTTGTTAGTTTTNAAPGPATPPAPGGGGNVTATYVFYTDANNGLYAVNPSSPATPITIETSGVQVILPVSAGAYSTTTPGTITDVHDDSKVYVATALYKVSALLTGGAVRAQLGTSTFAAGTATAYCKNSLQVLPDYQTPANSKVVYTQAGPDKVCSTTDDLNYVIALSASPTTAPILIASNGELGTTLIPINDTATGALTGVLATWLSNVVQTDASLTFPGTTVMSGRLDGLLSTNSAGKMLLLINSTIYAYDPTIAPAAGTNPVLPGNIASTPGAGPYLSDNTNMYFNLGGKTIYRMPMDGSAAPTLMYTLPTGTSIQNKKFMLTANRVIFAWENTTTYANGVSSLPKTASGATTPTVLAQGTQPVSTLTGQIYQLHSVAGTAVNYNDVWNMYAYHVNEDGSGLVTYGNPFSVANPSNFTNVWWRGHISASSRTLGMNDGSNSLRAFLQGMQGTCGATSCTYVNSYYAYDVATGNFAVNMGATANNNSLQPVYGGAYFGNNYGTIYTFTDTSNVTHAFYLNANVTNSLTEMPNSSPPVNQTFIGEGGY